MDFFGKKNKHKAKHHKKVAKEYKEKFHDLEKRYGELSTQSEQGIRDLLSKLANCEVEKDALRLAVRLQTTLINLLLTVNADSNQANIGCIEEYTTQINTVLEALNEEPIQQNFQFGNSVHSSEDVSKPIVKALPDSQ